MNCTYPLIAFRTLDIKTGKNEMTFKEPKKGNSQQIKLPCGQCISCRLDKAKEWQTRIYHETLLHDENIFITLTYNDKNLPVNGNLKKKHFSDFIKRLRKYYKPKKIRFYHCGEYGEKLGRPHYHAILFNIDFEDKQIIRIEDGCEYYQSQLLTQLWGYGKTELGNADLDSISYVARYIMKKINGDLAETHYQRLDEETGELIQLQPEYSTMSRMPGIGYNWFQKWHKDVFPRDEIIIKQTPRKVPIYYDILYERMEPQKMEDIKQQREINQNKKDQKIREELERRDKYKHVIAKTHKRNKT